LHHPGETIRLTTNLGRGMKNIQVDNAVNCAYDIFAATDEEFNLIFPDGRDIEVLSQRRRLAGR
jgi:hypothetical protein